MFKELNTQWLLLIVFGTVFLVFTIFSGVLGVTEENKKFEYAVDEMPSDTLFSANVEEHLRDKSE